MACQMPDPYEPGPGPKTRASPAPAAAHRVVVGRLVVQGRHQPDGVVEQVDHAGEGVPEEARDADGDVDPGPAQLGQRHAPRGPRPVPSGGATPGRTPSRARASATSSPWVRMLAVPHTTRPTVRGQRAGLGHVALDQAVGQGPADVPRQRRGDGLGVDGVEVAPGRQHVGAAPGRRAAGPGRHVAAVEAGQQVGELVGRPAQGGDQRRRDPLEGRVAGRSPPGLHPRGGTRPPPGRRRRCPPSARSTPELGGHGRPQRRHRPLGLAGDGEDGVDQAPRRPAPRPSTCRPPRIWASLREHR